MVIMVFSHMSVTGVMLASRKISWTREYNPPTHDVTLHAKSRPKPVTSQYPEICDGSRSLWPWLSLGFALGGTHSIVLQL